MTSRATSGQAITKFAVLYAGVILPLTFMTFFVAEALWIWRGMVEFTGGLVRDSMGHGWTRMNTDDCFCVYSCAFVCIRGVKKVFAENHIGHEWTRMGTNDCLSFYPRSSVSIRGPKAYTGASA